MFASKLLCGLLLLGAALMVISVSELDDARRFPRHQEMMLGDAASNTAGRRGGRRSLRSIGSFRLAAANRAGNDELEEALDFTDAGDYATDLADSDDPADSASAEQGTGKQQATQKKAADQPMCSKKDTTCPKGYECTCPHDISSIKEMQTCMKNHGDTLPGAKERNQRGGDPAGDPAAAAAAAAEAPPPAAEAPPATPPPGNANAPAVGVAQSASVKSAEAAAARSAAAAASASKGGTAAAAKSAAAAGLLSDLSEVDELGEGVTSDCNICKTQVLKVQGKSDKCTKCLSCVHPPDFRTDVKTWGGDNKIGECAPCWIADPETGSACLKDDKSTPCQKCWSAKPKCCKCEKIKGLSVSPLVCSNATSPTEQWIRHYFKAADGSWSEDKNGTQSEGAVAEALCVSIQGSTVDFSEARWWEKNPCVTNECLIEKLYNKTEYHTKEICKSKDDLSHEDKASLDWGGIERARMLLDHVKECAVPKALYGSCGICSQTKNELNMKGMPCGPPPDFTNGGSSGKPMRTLLVAPAGAVMPDVHHKVQVMGAPDCRPACSATCGDLMTQEECGRAKKCEHKKGGDVKQNADGTVSQDSVCKWKPMKNAVASTSSSILTKGTNDGKACQISLTHATRIVDFNGVQVKGYFLKASVCKGEAINAQSTDKTRAMWPSQAAGSSCSVRKVLYKVNDQVLTTEMSRQFTLTNKITNKTTLDKPRIQAYKGAAKNSVAMII